MKIILVNGPPHSGKDTIAEALVKHLGNSAVVRKFALPLRSALISFAKFNDFNVEQLHMEIHRDDVKDTPNPLLFGKTPREFMIAFSETFAKPLWGHDIFGKIALRYCRVLEDRHFETVVFSDSGFAGEAQVLIDNYGAHSVRLIQLRRDGTTFKNDSRSYIDGQLSVPFMWCDNNRTVPEAIEDIDDWLEATDRLLLSAN